jgi:hypothetical protein
MMINTCFVNYADNHNPIVALIPNGGKGNKAKSKTTSFKVQASLTACKEREVYAIHEKIYFNFEDRYNTIILLFTINFAYAFFHISTLLSMRKNTISKRLVLLGRIPEQIYRE